MTGLFLFLLACQQGTSPSGAAHPDPVEHLSPLQRGLSAALLMWQGAQYTEAQQALEATYLEHFEPFEEALQEHGVDTVALEYAFGRLSWRMRRAGDPEELSGLVFLLQQDVEEALNVLPLPPAPE